MYVPYVRSYSTHVVRCTAIDSELVDCNGYKCEYHIMSLECENGSVLFAPHNLKNRCACFPINPLCTADATKCCTHTCISHTTNYTHRINADDFIALNNSQRIFLF